jgi:hypothetical protein
MDIQCSLTMRCPALCDRDTRTAASIDAHALLALTTDHESFRLANAPDLRPATLLTSFGKPQSTICRAVDKVCR